jgi:hypothetical protein
MGFRTAAEVMTEAKRPGWRNAEHAAQWSSTLGTYAYPKLCYRDIFETPTGRMNGPRAG